jgi:predicted nucleic acid-binding protein
LSKVLGDPIGTPADERCGEHTQAGSGDAEVLIREAASIPDLLIAATAELCGLGVLHVDKNFELIADVTGQTQARLPVTAN